MIITYSFKIRHSQKHSRWIESTLDATRFVYNLAKETKEESYKKGVTLSVYDLQKQFTQCKKEKDFTWLNDIPSQTSQAIIERMENSFKSFFKGGGYPKWVKKKKWRSIPFKQIKQIDKNTFRLHKIGDIKVFNPKWIKGVLKTAQIIKECNGYYLKIQFEKETENICKPSKDVGVDRGLVYFIVTSDGEFINNPEINKRTEKKLRILNRKLSRTKRGSKNRIKIIEQLQKVYLKRSRQRLDFLHKLTTKLSSKYNIIYLEDLNISKMIKNKNFSRKISDVAWYKFEELLKYKSFVHKIDAYYTSQECSVCGNICKNNRISQSVFECTSCDNKMNADLNASKVILKRGRADLYNVKVNH